MSRITYGYIPATTHRVVREPHMERYSCPLEVKANDDALLSFIHDSKLINEFREYRKQNPVQELHPGKGSYLLLT